MAYRSDATGEARIHVRSFPGIRVHRLVSDEPATDPLGVATAASFSISAVRVSWSFPVETGDTFQRGAPKRLSSLDRYYEGAYINWGHLA